MRIVSSVLSSHGPFELGTNNGSSAFSHSPRLGLVNVNVRQSTYCFSSVAFAGLKVEFDR